MGNKIEDISYPVNLYSDKKFNFEDIFTIMKAEIIKKDKKDKNWALPRVNLTLDEFVAGIHKAEDGPFYTLEEMQILRNQWRNSKKDQ